MRSILIAVGLFAVGSMVGCADVLGIEPWEDKSSGPSSSGGGSKTDSTSGQGATGPGVDACHNGVQDGSESGVDCGGGACEPCADARGCAADADCESRFCPVSRGYCVLSEGRGTCGVEEMENPSCGDCVKNSIETDIDCGGDCLPCRAGKVCATDGECWSNFCVNGICAAGMANTRCFSNADCSGECTAAVSMSGCDFESCCL